LATLLRIWEPEIGRFWWRSVKGYFVA